MRIFVLNGEVGHRTQEATDLQRNDDDIRVPHVYDFADDARKGSSCLLEDRIIGRSNADPIRFYDHRRRNFRNNGFFISRVSFYFLSGAAHCLPAALLSLKPLSRRGTHVILSPARDFHSWCDTKYLMIQVNVGCDSSGSRCRRKFRSIVGILLPGESRLGVRTLKILAERERERERQGVEWEGNGGIALFPFVRNRYRARTSDVNYYARRSANCLIAWRAFDSDTILARCNIYIKSPLNQSTSCKKRKV